MAGIYKITFLRTEWIEQVNTKTAISSNKLIILLAFIYSTVVYFLNSRLNKPLKQLMQQMRAFAKGEKTEPFAIKNDELR